MAHDPFKSSVYQLDFATSMIKMVLEQAKDSDKSSVELAAIRLSIDSIMDASPNKRRCLLRLLAQVNTIMAEVINNG